jgi:dTDP-3-amino-3,4,6-trideoxy-alpha-D-glucose transaminase
MTVPVVDLSRRGAALAPALADAAARIATSGTILLGPETTAFEAEFARWLGAEQAVAVASGATALQLALRALGVGPGDEVIVPAMTAVPTAAAVCATGATPVFADVDPATATLDPHAAAAVRTERTRVVVPVHLYGHPAAAPELPGVDVLIDAAQAHGAVAEHAAVAAVAYSFYPTKNLGGIGDGGAVAVTDPVLADRIRLLRGHGLTEDYVHTEISQNFRMSELEAAWLRLALPDLAAGNARRAAIVAHYRAAAPGLSWQSAHPAHVYHLAVVKVADRPAFRAALAAAGVATAVHYTRALTQQPAYSRFVGAACPNAEAWAAGCVSLPCFPELTDAEVEHVAGALTEVQP